MLSERRWSARKPISMNVAIYYDRLGLLPCKTRDMSVEGMFITTGRVTLAIGSQVDAVFTMRHRNPREQLRLPARIVRVNEEGAGLRFRKYDYGTYQHLRRMLDAA